MEWELMLYTDLDRLVDLCSLGGALARIKGDITVMVTSRREEFHGLQRKVTSDGGEAERLKSSLREHPATCGVTE